MTNARKRQILVAIFCLVCLAVIVGPQCLLAQADQNAAPETSPDALPKPPGVDPFAVFVKAFGLLALLSLLLYMALKTYKSQVLLKKPGGGSALIQVLHSTFIGPKKSLLLVQTLDHVLLLGVTDHQITVLMELPKDDLNDQTLSSLLSGNQKPNGNFKNLLKQMMAK